MGWEHPLEKGIGYTLQYSGQDSSMDCIVNGVAKSRTRMNDFHFQEAYEEGLPWRSSG